MVLSHMWLLLGVFAVVGHAAACSEETCGNNLSADEQVDSIDSSSLNLLQTDIRVALQSGVEKVNVHDARPTGAPVTTTEKGATTTYHKPEAAAAAAGVKTNAAGDLMAFITAIVTNTFTVFFCVGCFMCLKGRYPLTFTNNLQFNKAPLNAIQDGSFGWLRSSWAATTSEVMENAGLDQAMLLEFCNMAMKIMAIIGVPMICIMGPVNCFFGGNAAGEDHLSYLSFGNVVDGSQLYWIHACIVWCVLFTVHVSVFRAQKNFLGYRFQWLRELPNPRANTVLVEGIPLVEDENNRPNKRFRTSAELRDFFTSMFGQGKVASTYVVRKFPELEYAWASREATQKAMDKASAQGKNTDDLQQNLKDLDTQIKTLQNTVNDGYNTASGFVSFHNQSDVAFALSVQFGEDADEWEVSVPPEPTSIIWNDLKQSAASRSGLTTLGYLLTAALYMLYMPGVIGITQVAVKINMGPLQPLWAGLAPTLGLQFMVGFLPTFLILIFRFCFTLKDDAWAQQILQNWYFVFQVVFVILVTAIGGSMLEFLDTLVEKPLAMFGLLAKTMPYATHFYMNYLVLQWATHGMVLMRYVPLSKWFLAKGVGFDEETARQMSEPEDQDYYGIGSRSARFAINLCVGIIYGTMSPPINFLCFVEFLICRVVYGYLTPFAETRKPDLGGVFWVHKLKHVFVGCIIYSIVMTGVLLGRASTNGPGLLAAPSIFYVVHSMRTFERSFCWEKLPFDELKKDEVKEKSPGSQSPPSVQKKRIGEYVQPWMEAITK